MKYEGESPPELSIDSLIGICIKDLDGKVLSLNNLCRSICGDKLSTVCQVGCMKFYERNQDEQNLFSPISTFRNIYPGENQCDAVVINNGSQLITLLFPKSHLIQKIIERLNQLGLTRAEQSIFLMALDKLSNVEMAQKLFISPSTVKTHLNNIYKKIPTDLKKLISIKRRS